MTEKFNMHIDATPEQARAIREQARKLGVKVSEIANGLSSLDVRLYVNERHIDVKTGRYFTAVIHDPTYSRTVWRVEELRKLDASAV